MHGHAQTDFPESFGLSVSNQSPMNKIRLYKDDTNLALWLIEILRQKDYEYRDSSTSGRLLELCPVISVLSLESKSMSMIRHKSYNTGGHDGLLESAHDL